VANVPDLAGQTDIQIAEASYHRCASNDAFYSTLYEHLLASDPRIPPMFANTSFERQHKVLRHGLGVLIIYAKRPNPALLERIALRHSRADVDVPPALYPSFVESLIAAIAAHDPEYAPAVGEAWRAAMRPGIAYMTSLYDGGVA
jgi:hemoglobin-like flavoprotein